MQLLSIYKKLYSAFGSQKWWPADSAFEVCIGAILTQNTAWSNVEKAIAKLKAQNALSIKSISRMPLKKLAKIIHSTGYYNQKAQKLKFFCNHILQNYNGSLQKMLSKRIPELRVELLSMKGIGPETADSIILYAAKKPIFVVDAYTKRFYSRILGKEVSDYDELQEIFQNNLPKNTKLFNEFHALIVKHSKEFCRKKPKCKNCFFKQNCCFQTKG